MRELMIALAAATALACGGVEGDEAPDTSEEALTSYPNRFGIPNLTVRATGFDAATGQQSLECQDQMDFRIVVTNNGSGPARASKLWMERYFDTWGYIDVPSIAAGSSHTIWQRVTIPATASSWTAGLRVDATNVVGELSEIDNTASASCGF